MTTKNIYLASKQYEYTVPISRRGLPAHVPLLDQYLYVYTFLRFVLVGAFAVCASYWSLVSQPQAMKRFQEDDEKQKQICAIGNFNTVAVRSK